MNEQREVIGFVDPEGCLNQWYVDECRVWSLESMQPGRIFFRQGVYVWLGELDRNYGQLAQKLPIEVAAKLLLVHGFELPNDLLRYLVEQIDKPKTRTRSKPRRPSRPPKAQHGLAGFAKANDSQSHERVAPESHDRQGHLR